MRRQGAAYVDGAGFAHVELPGLFIHVEARDADRRRRPRRRPRHREAGGQGRRRRPGSAARPPARLGGARPGTGRAGLPRARPQGPATPGVRRHGRQQRRRPGQGPARRGHDRVAGRVGRGDTRPGRPQSHCVVPVRARPGARLAGGQTASIPRTSSTPSPAAPPRPCWRGRPLRRPSSSSGWRDLCRSPTPFARHGRRAGQPRAQRRPVPGSRRPATGFQQPRPPRASGR